MPQPPSRSRVASIRTRRWLSILAGLAALGVVLVLLFTRLGEYGLRGDEGFYGLVVADLLEPGGGLRLTMEGKPFLNKPPLAFWLMGLSAAVLGLDEFSLRLPGAIVSLLLAALVFSVGWRRSGAAFAALSVLLFLTARHSLYFHGWRAAVTEPLLALLTVASLLAWCHVAPRRRRLLALAALSALNGLTKGLVGPVLAAATIAIADRIARGSRRSADDPRQEAGLAATLAATLLPAALGYVGWWLWNNPHPDQFLPFLNRDWFRRATGDLQASHVQPVGYFVRRGAEDFGLWILLAIPALLPATWRGLRERRDLEGMAIRLLPLVTLIAFSIPASKIAWYIYPAYPFFALMLAEEARSLLDRLRPSRPAWVVAIVFVTALLAQRVVAAHSGLSRAPAASLVRLARIVDATPGAVVRFDDRLLQPENRPREWNRFTLFHRIGAQPWRATEPFPSGGCVFIVSADPSLLGPAGLADSVAIVAQARSRPEPPLVVFDRCGGRFSRQARLPDAAATTTAPDPD